MLAGPGAPLVAEFAIPEFAAALRMTTDAGKALIADAVETKHRLPKSGPRVMAGDLPIWRARRIAQTTIGLSQEAATFVDRQVAPFAHKLGPAAVDRLVTEATARFMPAKAREDAERALDGRHVTFHHDHVSFTGTTYLEAELDLADALDLDAALVPRSSRPQGGRLGGVAGRPPGDRGRGDRPPPARPRPRRRVSD